MTGSFLDLWLSQLMNNPDAEKIISDIHQFSDVSQRLATSMEKLPDQISAERKQMITDFNANEKPIRDILSELTRTMQSGTTLVTETHSLLSLMDSMKGPAQDPAEPSKPFDILEFKETITEASIAVDKINNLFNTADKLMSDSDAEKTMAILTKFIDRIGDEGDERISYFFLWGMGLLGAFLIGQLSTLVMYRFINNRYFSDKGPSTAGKKEPGN